MDRALDPFCAALAATFNPLLQAASILSAQVLILITTVGQPSAIACRQAGTYACGRAQASVLGESHNHATHAGA